MPQDQPHGGFVRLCFQVQLDRCVDLGLAFHQPGRPYRKLRDTQGRVIGSRLSQQEGAKERVILVGQLHARMAIDEQMMLVEVSQQLACRRVAAQLLGHGHGKPRQRCGAHQCLACFRGCLVEYLRGEVIEHRFPGQSLPQPVDFAGSPQSLAHQREARCPAVAVLVQLAELFVVQGFARRRYAASLLERKAQLVPIHGCEAIRGEQARKFRRRVGPTEHDQVRPFGDLLRRCCQHSVQSRVGRYLLVVVQHYQRVPWQPAEELPPPAPGETGKVGEIFGRQKGKRGAFASAQAGGSLSQIVEETCRVGVAAVELVPQARNLMSIEVTCRQCCLSRAGRPGDPDHRTTLLAHKRKQALARVGAMQPRTRQLGENGGLLRHDACESALRLRIGTFEV